MPNLGPIDGCSKQYTEDVALTIFSPMFKSRLFAALVVSTLLVALLSSCQSSSSDSETPANIIKFSGTASTGQTLDSVSWNFNADSGAGKIQLQAGTANTYDVQLTLPRDPGTAPISVTFWKLSIKVGISPVTSGVLGKGTWRDTLGNVLLVRLDSLRRSKDSTNYPQTIQSLIQIYAHALVDGDTTFKGFPKRRVTTLDTAAIYKAAMVYAASKRIPYTVLSKTWTLGLDSVSTLTRLASLSGKNGSISSADSLAFFPPFPVRLATSLSIKNLNIGGTAVSVSGSFVGDSGLSSYSVRITQDSIDRTTDFLVTALPAQPNGTQASWDLAKDAQLAIQSKSAVVGTYLLKVWASDSKKRSDTGRVRFQVLPPPDITGPNLRWISPTSDTVIENADSLLKVILKVQDSSGVNTVLVDGMLATRSDSTWSLSVKIPVTDLGYVLKVHAQDSLGNPTDTSIRVVRKSARNPSAPPKIIKFSPMHDTSVAWGIKSFLLSWAVTGDTTIAKVTLDGQVLTASSNIYQSTVSLKTGDNEFIVAALDNRGNPATDTIRIKRYADTTKPVVTRVHGTNDTVLSYEVTKLSPSWKVSDNILDSVTINGVLAKATSGVFNADVPVSGDSLWVVLIARDSSLNTTRDSIKVRRLAAPSVLPAGGILTGNQTTTASIMTNLPDAVISYSTNKTDWTIGNSRLISSSQILYVRAAVGAVTSRIDSVIFLYAPVSSVPSGTYTSSQSVTFNAAGGVIVEDSLSTGTTWVDASASLNITGNTKVFTRSRLGSKISSVVETDYAFKPSIKVDSTDATSKTLLVIAPNADSIETSSSLSSAWTKLTGTKLTISASGTYYARVHVGVIVSAVDSIVVSQTPGLVGWNPNVTYGSLSDTRDGKQYRTVKIGSQTWMAENLNYAGPTDTVVGVCYGNDTLNCIKYGRLYTWNEATKSDSSSLSPSGIQGICPDHWHVPSNAEWKTMRNFVDPSWTVDATRLKSALGWNGTDDFGFRILPTGIKTAAGFPKPGAGSDYFWTSTRSGANWAESHHVTPLPDFAIGADLLTNSYSLRCVAN